MTKTKAKIIALWIAKIVPAAFLLQTLIFFKFPAHEVSVDLFTQLGILGLPEHFGRLGTGIAELIAVILLLIPKTQKIGAGGVIILMLGALGAHVMNLGFQGDNLPLAIMAVVLIICSGYVLKSSKS